MVTKLVPDSLLISMLTATPELWPTNLSTTLSLTLVVTKVFTFIFLLLILSLYQLAIASGLSLLVKLRELPFWETIWEFG